MEQLEQEVIKAFKKMAADGAIEKAIQENVEKSVTDAIHEVLGRYSSPFSRGLKEGLSKALAVDIESLGLDGYNDIVLKIVKQKLDAQVMIAGKAQLEKDLEELLKAPGEEIKLSKLVDLLKESRFDDDEPVACFVEWSDGLTRGYCRVYLDRRSCDDKEHCDYELAVTDKGDVYSFRINGRDPRNQIFVGPFYGFDRALFQMYTAKTRLIIDEDDVNVHPDRD